MNKCPNLPYKSVDTHGLTPVALKKAFANLSIGIHPRSHARGPLPILIEK